MITYDDFLKVDIRVGRIVSAEIFPEARKPAYRLKIDFGKEIGLKQSSVQITENYKVRDLPGKLVAAVVNFPQKKIAGFSSEVLTLGFPDENGKVVLVSPDTEVPLGSRLF
ncbi:MAG: tRNA-binding protein [Candidatus Diapherotrites archaeon]|uniref:tRNA-binding protein n=1 Tax=Candidatus Iainarchaeum sp. TaxID=3101447 RepID=A0A8T3YPF1_9ARCH|nr:tRNA-binding protein [Candidatus Diapherotrites archaeon]